jgi:hypothetical protein
MHKKGDSEYVYETRSKAITSISPWLANGMLPEVSRKVWKVEEEGRFRVKSRVYGGSRRSAASRSSPSAMGSGQCGRIR